MTIRSPTPLACRVYINTIYKHIRLVSMPILPISRRSTAVIQNWLQKSTAFWVPTFAQLMASEVDLEALEEQVGLDGSALLQTQPRELLRLGAVKLRISIAFVDSSGGVRYRELVTAI